MLRKRLLPVLLFAAVSASADNVKLTVHVDSRPIDPRRSVTKMRAVREVKAESRNLEVTLGPGYLIEKRQDGTVILDFEKRLRFDQSPGEAPTVSSLFAVVGGRVREMTNRRYLVDMMERAGRPATIPLAISEHDLSMRAEPPVSGITRQEKDGVVRFRWKKADLGEFTKETVPDTQAEGAPYARFIRHAFSGHPQLLEALEQLGGIPRRLRLVSELESLTHDISVSAIERQPDAPYDAPADPAMSLAMHPQWGPLMKRATEMTPEAVRSHVAESEKAADAAFAAGRPLEAFLLYLESNLTLGDSPAGLEKNGPVLTEDPVVARVREAIAPEDAPSARKSLVLLAETRATLPEAAHILRIFEGNLNSNLDENEKAYEHFYAVLSDRPAIAGVWHDLGMMFLGGYDAVAAWDCWEVAKRIAPEHGMVKAIEEREAYLLARYPEFF
jgi:hypothetical protein